MYTTFLLICKREEVQAVFRRICHGVRYPFIFHGNNGEFIFYRNEDKKLFLATATEMSSRFGQDSVRYERGIIQ